MKKLILEKYSFKYRERECNDHRKIVPLRNAQEMVSEVVNCEGPLKVPEMTGTQLSHKTIYHQYSMR